MSLSSPFVRRPVGTTLMTIALVIAGVISFRLLPVAPLPQVDFPTISVVAGLPGASPETMASAVATPLERQFGRIAGVTEMTSVSFLGASTIALQFDLARDINGAARDVQSAIAAAAGQLPPNLPSLPTYRKVNPADAPIMILALTSKAVDKGRMYDIASTVLQQKIARLEGVGQIFVGGSSLPAVRVELNPMALARYGIGLDEVRQALATANVNRPKGQLDDGRFTWEINATDQLREPARYEPLIVAWRNAAPVRLIDVAEVRGAVEDLRAGAVSNGETAVVLVINRQPGVNIIDTVDRIRAELPYLRALVPAEVTLRPVLDQTVTIRASVKNVEEALLISIGLVVLVVFLFLRNIRATIIPGIVVPVSLIGTFAIMYLVGYSIDNLSLMAPLTGAKEIGFTVLSMSISLVAVFIPILLMGGIVGRLFREFAVVLSVAVLVSLAISLTTTPMMCALLLRPQDPQHRPRLAVLGERIFDAITRAYDRTLTVALRHPAITMIIFLATFAVNVYLFNLVPKGFFPQQDNGRLAANIVAQQDVSFAAVHEKMVRYAEILKNDPAVDTVTLFTGGGGGRGTTANTGRGFISLKLREERKIAADDVITRLRPKLAQVPGATLYLQAVQDVRLGGRISNAQYQFTLQSDNLEELNTWAPRLVRAMREMPELRDVSSDQQNRGLEVPVVIDRATAARLGVSTRMIDETLYDAFGQRQVSTIYTSLNQYHVVMELEPRYWERPDALANIYVRATTGQTVPLTEVTKFRTGTGPIQVNHQGLFPSVTVFFNLAPNVALGDAVKAIDAAEQKMGFPTNISGRFTGTAQAFQAALANQPLLILAARVAVYIVLGVLYESLIHPLTILSTLPSAGVGALLALLICGMDLSVIAMIGIILLIGIVKKNAILVIDVALDLERNHGLGARDAVHRACLRRFRPILMTTMAALLGALPLALGTGTGSELRRPLGITVVGGLLLSQLLTLYTTPVIYIYMERFRVAMGRATARTRATLGLRSPHRVPQGGARP